MNLAHLHILLNHGPVFGALFAFLVLAWGACTGNREISRVGLGLTVLSALITIPTFLTGDPAADIVKTIPGVVRSSIGQHDDSAEYALSFMLAVGALALAAMIPKFPESLRKKLTTAVLVGTLFVSVIMARTAYLGGLIRHPEIRTESHGVTAAATNAPP